MIIALADIAEDLNIPAFPINADNLIFIDFNVGEDQAQVFIAHVSVADIYNLRSWSCLLFQHQP